MVKFAFEAKARTRQILPIMPKQRSVKTEKAFVGLAPEQVSGAAASNAAVASANKRINLQAEAVR